MDEELVLSKFIELGFKLNGPSEWTVLAGVVQHMEDRSYGSKVVAIGTGTTCMPTSTFAAASGSVGLRYQYVRDSHAEVVARRSFKAYLLKQIQIATVNEGGESCESIFYSASSSLSGDNKGDGGGSCLTSDRSGCTRRLQLRKGVSFSMYISQAPCGHASMHCFLPRSEGDEDDHDRDEDAEGADRDAVGADRDAMVVGTVLKRRRLDQVVTVVGRGHGDYRCQR